MQPKITDESWEHALTQMRTASNRFIQGDPTLWKQLCSHRDDATIMSGWGGFEKGWDEVGPRCDWAASRFAAGELEIEYLARGSSGDLAYTVMLERSHVRLAGREESAPMVLRVTHIYRREAAEWKLVHRHADPLMNVTSLAAVLQS